MKPLTDRRLRERFDVVGAMWGLLELSEPARIQNVSTTGALIDSPHPSALDSTLALRVMIDGQPVRLDGLVRHVQRTETETETNRGRYLIGLEFSSPPESVIQSIEQLGAELSALEQREAP